MRHKTDFDQIVFYKIPLSNETRLKVFDLVLFLQEPNFKTTAILNWFERLRLSWTDLSNYVLKE